MPARRVPVATKVPAGLKIRPHLAVAVAESADAEIGGNGLDWSAVPKMLDDEGRAEWVRLSEIFDWNPTRFREGDRAAVTAYCAYWSLFEASGRDVTERGPVVEGRSDKDRGRMVKNPASVAQREASTQLRYWARELGLTPDARGRMGLTDDGKKEIDDADNPYA